jgi:Na+-driven multidrug efflux pump
MRRHLYELKRWAGVSVSSCFSLVIQQLPDVIALIFLGRVGLDELAAVSLAGVWAYGIGLVLWVGLSITHGTLVSQAAGNNSYVAVYGWTLIRLAYDLVTVAVVTIPVFLTSHLFLARVGFDDVDFSIVREYLLWSLPVPFLITVIETLSVHMASIQRVWQPVVVEIIYAALDIVGSYVLILGVDAGPVHIAGFGVRGAALANVLSCAACLILYAIMFWFYSMPPNMDAFAEEEDRNDSFAELADEDSDEEVDATVQAAAELKRSGCQRNLSGDVPAVVLKSAASTTTPASATAPLLLHDALGSVGGATISVRDSVNASAVELTDGAACIPVTLTSAGTHANVGSAATPDRRASAVSAGSKASKATGESERTGSTKLDHDSAVARVSWAAVWRFATMRKNIVTFGKQTGPSVLSMALEIGQQQLLSFLAADMGAVQVAVQNSLSEIYELGGMVLYGMGEATTIRVGYTLGNARVAAAKRVVVAAGAAVCVWACIAGALFVGLKDRIGQMFSDDPRVIAAAAGITPWMAGAYAFYAVYIHFAAVLDGQGRSSSYPIISLIGCWVVTGTLAGLSLRFTSFGLQGLWGAEMIGCCVSAAMAVLLVLRSDWRRLSAQAIERSEYE